MEMEGSKAGSEVGHDFHSVCDGGARVEGKRSIH
jgi:hypothetical protein